MNLVIVAHVFFFAIKQTTDYNITTKCNVNISDTSILSYYLYIRHTINKLPIVYNRFLNRYTQNSAGDLR